MSRRTLRVPSPQEREEWRLKGEIRALRRQAETADPAREAGITSPPQQTIAVARWLRGLLTDRRSKSRRQDQAGAAIAALAGDALMDPLDQDAGPSSTLGVTEITAADLAAVGLAPSQFKAADDRVNSFAADLLDDLLATHGDQPSRGDPPTEQDGIDAAIDGWDGDSN